MPIIIIGALSFAFQSSVAEIDNQIFLKDCPYAINGGIASNVTISDNKVIYDIEYDNSTQDYRLTTFKCTVTDGLQGVSTAVYTQTSTNWFQIDTSYLAYLSNSISQFLGKIQPTLTLAYLYVNAPAEATNLEFFSYINGVMLGLFGLGLFMVFKPGGT